MKKNFTHKLTESAVLLALGTVLSFVKLLDLPAGGSITLCSMLPILLISYRFGMGFGFLSGFIYSIIQLLSGLKTLSYATSAMAAVAIILLDYIVAFTVIGLGGIFRKIFKNQTTALTVGMAFVCILRYICHTISGCTVWAGLSIPTEDALIYSIGYNATYMLPELLISTVFAFYISSAICFEGERLSRKISHNSYAKYGILSSIGKGLAVVTAIIDILLIAPHLQNSDSGEFFIEGIKNVNFPLVLGVTVLGAFLSLILILIPKFTIEKD